MRRGAILRPVLLASFAIACASQSGARRVDHLHSEPADAAPSDCADDAHEEDDTVGEVLGRADNASKPGVYDKLVSCPADDDVFHAYGDGTLAGAIVSWSAAEGELKVDLLDERGRVLPLDGAADRADRSAGKIELTHPVTGDFYVRVRNLAGTRITYRLELRTP